MPLFFSYFCTSLFAITSNKITRVVGAFKTSHRTLVLLMRQVNLICLLPFFSSLGFQVLLFYFLYTRLPICLLLHSSTLELICNGSHIKWYRWFFNPFTFYYFFFFFFLSSMDAFFMSIFKCIYWFFFSPCLVCFCQLQLLLDVFLFFLYFILWEFFFFYSLLFKSFKTNWLWLDWVENLRLCKWID